MSFCTVGLKDNHLGVFANAGGDFKIKRDQGFLKDSLVITCIGYRRKALALSELSSTEVNIISLVPALYNLNEIKVTASKRKINALLLVERAIRYIDKNYPKKPFSYVSYYRGYQKHVDEYLNLDEAIIQTIDKGFRTKSVSNHYKLLDFRQNFDFQRIKLSPFYDTVSNPFFSNRNKFIIGATLPDHGGNEFFILMVHDAIRNHNIASFSFINILDRDFVNNHTFSEVIPVYNDKLLLYKVNFQAKKWLTGDSLTVSGSVYIQPENYSIHRLDYSGAYLKEGKIKKEMFNIRSEYGREMNVDNLMYPKYLSFSNIFNVIDTTDNNYFRVTDSYTFEDQRNILYFDFNNRVDTTSALIKENYRIYLNDKEMNIRDIKVNDKRATIIFDLPKKTDDNSFKLSAFVKNIKDIDGSIVNERMYIEYYQYRELFVQEYNLGAPIGDSCILRDIPLIQNCISSDKQKSRYWMNTPVNIRSKQ